MDGNLPLTLRNKALNGSTSKTPSTSTPIRPLSDQVDFAFHDNSSPLLIDTSGSNEDPTLENISEIKASPRTRNEGMSCDHRSLFTTEEQCAILSKMDSARRCMQVKDSNEDSNNLAEHYTPYPSSDEKTKTDSQTHVRTRSFKSFLPISIYNQYGFTDRGNYGNNILHTAAYNDNPQNNFEITKPQPIKTSHSAYYKQQHHESDVNMLYTQHSSSEPIYAKPHMYNLSKPVTYNINKQVVNNVPYNPTMYSPQMVDMHTAELVDVRPSLYPHPASNYLPPHITAANYDHQNAFVPRMNFIPKPTAATPETPVKETGIIGWHRPIRPDMKVQNCPPMQPAVSTYPAQNLPRVINTMQSNISGTCLAGMAYLPPQSSYGHFVSPNSNIFTQRHPQNLPRTTNIIANGFPINYYHPGIIPTTNITHQIPNQGYNTHPFSYYPRYNSNDQQHSFNHVMPFEPQTNQFQTVAADRRDQCRNSNSPHPKMVLHASDLNGVKGNPVQHTENQTDFMRNMTTPPYYEKGCEWLKAQTPYEETSRARYNVYNPINPMFNSPVTNEGKFQTNGRVETNEYPQSTQHIQTKGNDVTNEYSESTLPIQMKRSYVTNEYPQNIQFIQTQRKNVANEYPESTQHIQNTYISTKDQQNHFLIDNTNCSDKRSCRISSPCNACVVQITLAKETIDQWRSKNADNPYPGPSQLASIARVTGIKTFALHDILRRQIGEIDDENLFLIENSKSKNRETKLGLQKAISNCINTGSMMAEWQIQEFASQLKIPVKILKDQVEKRIKKNSFRNKKKSYLK